MALMDRRRALMGQREGADDQTKILQDKTLWIGGTITGYGTVAPGPQYGQIVLSEPRTDLFDKYIHFSSGYQIYVWYYNNDAGESGGNGSGWISTSPTLIQSASASRRCVRILFKPTSIPESIDSIIPIVTDTP